jgi:hypothetical protein
VYPLYGGTTFHSEYLNRFSTMSSRKVFFGPSAFRSLRIFHRSSSLRKAIRHREGATVGGLLRRRRSHKKKHLRKMDTKPKHRSESFEVYFQMHRLKDEMTNQPMIACIMIVIICKGHECNFSQAAPCAYKWMNSTPVLFTLSCTCLCATPGFSPSVKPKV